MSVLYDPYGKKIDEDWKAQVERERSAGVPGEASSSRSQSAGATQQKGAPRAVPPAGEGRSGEGPAEADFSLLLSSLSMQAMMALGELPHPETRENQLDLVQAKYLIDTLGVLQEKTRGNLTSEEASLLEGLLYELRMKYVARVQETK